MIVYFLRWKTVMLLTFCPILAVATGEKSAARKWTSSTGTYQVEAELVEIKGHNVRLKKSDGKVARVDTQKLSSADQQFVRKELAVRITKDVGNVQRVSTTNKLPWVIIFEETHVSRLGQGQIALMLLRLYRDHAVRHVALEGFVEGTSADAAWFHELSAPPRTRHRVVTRLLAEGEISAAEHLALTFPDTKLHAIEAPEEYHAELEGTQNAAPVLYLMQIAIRSIRDQGVALKVQSIQQELEQLTDKAKIQSKTEELVDLIINADPWTAERYKVLKNDSNTILQTEDFIALINEIKAKARAVGYEGSSEEEESLNGFKDFFEARQKASGTMVRLTRAVAEQSPNAPVAMNIGAAHTNKVCDGFDALGLGYVVVRAKSLDQDLAQISMPAFERKGKKLSVDVNKLGALLDGRDKQGRQKKPEPIVAQHWFKAKTAAYDLSDMIAEAAAASPGDEPPFGMSDTDLDLGIARVETDSIKRISDNVVFKVSVLSDNAVPRQKGDENDPSKWKSIWARAKFVGREPVTSSKQDYDAQVEVEKMLLMLLDQFGNEPPDGPRNPKNSSEVEDPENPATETDTTPFAHVSLETIAIFSEDESAVLKKAI